MAKQLLSGEEARSKLLAGAAKMAAVVGSTLGPCGHDVLIGAIQGYQPDISRDGVTVARSITLPDAAEDAAAAVLRDAAQRTVSEAGDGTTTTIILAEALFRLGCEKLDSGEMTVLDFRRTCELAAREACQAIDKMALPIHGEMIERVATISANNDPELGAIVAKAARFAGQTGVITIENSSDWTTSVDMVEGMSIQAGYFSPYFASAHGMAILEWDNPQLLISGARLSRITDNIVSVVTSVLKKGHPLVILCPDTDGPFLASMVMTALETHSKIAIVRVPGIPDEKSGILSDFALATGARAVNLDMGMDEKDIGINDLGSCSKVTMTKDRTILAGTQNSKDVHGRVSQLIGMQRDERDPLRREILERRIARLTTGIVSIKVGASSDTGQRQKKARIEDAVLACRCALDEGVVPGGGAAYFNASLNLDEPFVSVLSAPLMTLYKGAGLKTEWPRERETKNAYDVRSGKYCDMFDAGILDPAKVVKSAIRNAFSAAAILAGTDHIIIPEQPCK